MVTFRVRVRFRVTVEVRVTARVTVSVSVRIYTSDPPTLRRAVVQPNAFSAFGGGEWVLG